MADKKVTELTAITSVSGDDLLLVVNDPLGTPESRKVTLKNFFSEISVEQVFTAQSTFEANTTFSGNKMTITANVSIDGTDVMGAIDDRMQVANVQSYIANTNSWLTASNTRFDTYSNTVNFRLDAQDDVLQGFGFTFTSNSISVTSNTGLVVSGGGLTDQVPSTSNASSESIAAGTIWYSNNHLYIATDENTIKRVELSTF
jgi:hypothetical protein